MMTNKLTVLFATDQGYIPHLATAIFSLLENNKALKIKIVVFTSKISFADQKKLEKISNFFESSIKFEILDDNLFEGLILNHHFQKSNYYRLFAADLIDEDKCLYLDADLIVTGALDSLLEIELGESFLAAVEDPGFNRHESLGMKQNSKYFNSGVMLINLRKWREENVRIGVIEVVKAKGALIKFVDQCGLNSVVDGSWLELDRTFNFQSWMVLSGSAKDRDTIPNYKIVHFTGSSKPWQMQNKHIHKRVYWKYRQKTPYKTIFFDDFNFLTISRCIMPASIKYILKSFHAKIKIKLHKKL